MAKSKAEELRMTPEEYAKILEDFQLEEISLVACKAVVNAQNTEANTHITIGIKGDNSHSVNENGSVEIHQAYFLTAKLPKTKKNVVEIEARYRMVFSSTGAITDDFLRIYRAVNLEFVIWPFFREFANSMTSRMNIPPLTLPFIKEHNK